MEVGMILEEKVMMEVGVGFAGKDGVQNGSGVGRGGDAESDGEV